jgi:hypothetical protein
VYACTYHCAFVSESDVKECFGNSKLHVYIKETVCTNILGMFCGYYGYFCQYSGI